MQPILFTIGDWTIRSYDACYLLGGIVGGVLGIRLGLASGVPWRRMLLYYLLVFPLAVAAGLLNGMLFNPYFYEGLKYGLPVLQGGITTYGSIAAAFAVTALFARHTHRDGGRDLDMLAQVFAVMLVFFRLGCLLNGCCYGRETDGFGGLILPDIYREWARRYPTQFLLIGLDLALAVGLWWYGRKRPAPGILAAWFLFCFGLGRFLIDGLRPLWTVLGPLSLHMLADLLFLLVGSAWLFLLYRRKVRDEKVD